MHLFIEIVPSICEFCCDLIVFSFSPLQEPLLKIEIDNPALLAGNWSQLCTTCKVSGFLDFVCWWSIGCIGY